VGPDAERRRARYYQLTPAGERQLDVELGRFERVMGAVFRALGTA
jgi:DNA-binding PadR family transcriptional regulator